MQSMPLDIVVAKSQIDLQRCTLSCNESCVNASFLRRVRVFTSVGVGADAEFMKEGSLDDGDPVHSYILVSFMDPRRRRRS